MFPMWFFQVYLGVSVFLFAFGPWPWPVSNPFLLYGFLVAAQGALWFGYKSGANQIPTMRKPPIVFNSKINRMITVSLITNLLWFIPNFMQRTGIERISFSSFIQSVISGWLNPGVAYQTRLESLAYLDKTGSLVQYSSIIISPLLWLFVPLSILYWDYLRKWQRISMIGYVLLDILGWISIGTNKGIGDYFAILPWTLLARDPRILPRFKLSRSLKPIALVTILALFFITFFGSGQYGRHSVQSTQFFDPIVKIQADSSNILMQCLPRSAQGGILSLISYLDQGYYGLSLALEKPFVWTYGLGNSYFLTGLSRRFLGPSAISDLTYPARIEGSGYDRDKRWHSFYTWAASDVSFPGVLFLVFIIGRLFAMVWMDVVVKKDPTAFVLFPLLVLMLYYFPANNQVLAFYQTAVPFLTFLFLWLRASHRRVFFC